MPNVDLFDSYYLQAATEEIVPLASFFKDRYFPTGADDIFAADKVLTEYRKGDRKLAAFVALFRLSGWGMKSANISRLILRFRAC